MIFFRRKFQIQDLLKEKVEIKNCGYGLYLLYFYDVVLVGISYFMKLLRLMKWIILMRDYVDCEKLFI